MKNEKNMKEDMEFQEFGKKLPYKVPEDFFEKVSAKTLLEARKREQNSRQRVIVLRTFAVAASLAAVAFLGYLKFGTEKTQSIQTSEVVAAPLTEQPAAQIADTMRRSQDANENSRVAEAPITTEKAKSDENLSDVLADMSDDELIQLAAIYKSDTFLNESAN